MGPFENVGRQAFCKLWAITRLSALGLHAFYWPMRQPWQYPIPRLLPIVKILRRVQWSHARLACKSLQVMIGQLSLLGKEHPIKCWPLQASCSAAIQLATDYEGPVAAAAATNLTGNS